MSDCVNDFTFFEGNTRLPTRKKIKHSPWNNFSTKIFSVLHQIYDKYFWNHWILLAFSCRVDIKWQASHLPQQPEKAMKTYTSRDLRFRERKMIIEPNIIRTKQIRTDTTRYLLSSRLNHIGHPRLLSGLLQLKWICCNNNHFSSGKVCTGYPRNTFLKTPRNSQW